MNVYLRLGVFVKCANPLVEKIVDRHGCEKCQRVDNHDTYCRCCGTKMAPMPCKEQVRAIEHISTDGLEIITDYGSQVIKDFDIYSNKAAYGVERETEIYNTGVIEVKNIANEITLFSDVFNDDIQMLLRHYSSAEICWGLITRDE